MSDEREIALAQRQDTRGEAHAVQSLVSGVAAFSLEEFAVMELEERHELISCCGINAFACGDHNADCGCVNVCGSNVACVDAVCQPNTYCGGGGGGDDQNRT